MQRRNFIRHTSLALGALSLLDQKTIAAMLTDNPWKMKALRGDVGIFTEKGGTIAYLTSKKGIVVVDAEFPEQAGHLMLHVKSKSAKPVELLRDAPHPGAHRSLSIACTRL